MNPPLFLHMRGGSAISIAACHYFQWSCPRLVQAAIWLLKHVFYLPPFAFAFRGSCVARIPGSPHIRTFSIPGARLRFFSEPLSRRIDRVGRQAVVQRPFAFKAKAQVA